MRNSDLIDIIKSAKIGRKPLRKLLIYIRDYKLESILGPLFKLLEACMDLIVPLVMAYIIDKEMIRGL